MGSYQRPRRTSALVVVGWLLCGAVAWLAPTRSAAHGDLGERIQATSRQIAQEPLRADLYTQRADLHRQDGKWSEALADLERAAALDPGRSELEARRGHVLLEAGRPVEADAALGRYLAREPTSASARADRARARAALGRHLDAAADYTAAIESQPKPMPELFLQRARALVAAGPEHREAALAGLDEGIRRMGPVVALEMTALELEMDAGRTDAALARLARLASHSTRQETWLAQRGEILERAGRHAEAHEAFAGALRALERLPAHQRRTPAMEELEQRVRAAAVRVAEPSKTTPPAHGAKREPKGGTDT